MVKILFVCLGNICRSPMIEAIFLDLLNKEQLTKEIVVDSAGIANWHEGKRPHKGTLDKLTSRNVGHEWMKSRQITKEDWETFDYIIAMDDQNIEDLRAMMPDDSTTIVLKAADFINDEAITYVPDPYYTGDFDETYDLVTEASQRLLSYIREKHNF
ncbi:MAG TPA: low molecular weight protein-tyrosine-phosphatase [Bacillota bacterium]|nr:low molecular weight protein-tyrosine-phosphatase [Bacillota bacterium]